MISGSELQHRVDRQETAQAAVPDASASLKVDANKQDFLDSHLSDLKKNDAFVTVINVSSSASNSSSSQVQTQNGSEKKSATLPKSNRDSLRSISSPMTEPTSPLISSSTEDFISREGLAVVNTSSISSSSADSLNKDQDIQPLNSELDELILDNDQEIHDNLTGNLNLTTQDSSRGQPDGRDEEPADLVLKSAKNLQAISNNVENSEPLNSRASVRELMASWENRPPVQAKPVAPARTSKLKSKTNIYIQF